MAINAIMVLKIKVASTDSPTIGIDTPEDLQAAIEFCKQNNL